MFKPALIACLLMIFCGCKSKKQENMAYINPDKWMTLDAVHGNPLRGRPKEIREDFITDLSDTTFDGISKTSSYMIYRFDTAGNLTYRELGDGDRSYGKH